MGIINSFRKVLFIGTLFLVGFHNFCLAQKDTLRLSNEDIIVGEIKYLDKGIVTIKTVYSNVDIQVKWKEVMEINTGHLYLITLKNGERLKGRIKTVAIDTLQLSVVNPSQRTQNNIDLDEDNKINLHKEEVVLLDEINESFASRFNGEISLGFNLARSNKLRQFSVKTNLNYSGDRWGGLFNFNAIRSIQESTSPIQRYDANGTVLFYLPKDFFLFGMLGLLSNTQQLIELRVSSIVGAGVYFIHTNHSYWNFQAGLNNNDERFEGDLPSTNSLEAIMGTDLNFYDVGVFNFSGTLVAYKSFSTEGRWRSDARLDVTYKFIENFFLKVGFAMNYDNMPTLGATDFDYVVQSTLGWKF
ncbi:DUF481 domain-containing protein [Algoriphagus sp.]|uniref:DUF481 domain-containing protein n=1 Tax=Algoriphagus sp. TaxID=1872435 RepID=UPI0025E76F73|nr:DUF481 domain-containing protein [Algoriphagus sp.]